MVLVLDEEEILQAVTDYAIKVVGEKDDGYKVILSDLNEDGRMIPLNDLDIKAEVSFNN